MAVAATEHDAKRLLDRLLTAAPGSNNMYEDYPYFPRDRGRTAVGDTGEAVHLVVIEDEDGPVVSAVFGSLDAATTHAEELREPSGLEVTINDLTMETDDHDQWPTSN